MSRPSGSRDCMTLQSGPLKSGRPLMQVLSDGVAPDAGPAVWWLTEPRGLKSEDPRVCQPEHSTTRRPAARSRFARLVSRPIEDRPGVMGEQVRPGVSFGREA